MIGLRGFDDHFGYCGLNIRLDFMGRMRWFECPLCTRKVEDYAPIIATHYRDMHGGVPLEQA